MSKIGKQPVVIPNGVTVTITGAKVDIVGPKGNSTVTLPTGIQAHAHNSKIEVTQEKGKEDMTKALYGLSRALIANSVHGVYNGFEKKLELSGVGYRAQVAGNDLSVSIGFSHPVKIQAPVGIKFSVTENVITIAGIDPVLVGDIAANIRKIRPPEPYKGKGIKYVGEVIRKKAGKAAKAVGGAGAK